MADKPNILLIFTDMQRADTIHALGNSVIKTPHLDRLVQEGTVFSRCYTPSPVCGPARYCMHYGVYPQRCGLYRNGPMPDDNGKSYVQLLGEAGYRTMGIGKCHFMPEKAALRGYQARLMQEENISNPETDDYCRFLEEKGYDYIEPQGMRSEMYYIPQVSILPAEVHPSQWIGDRSVDFIKEAGGQDTPWHLFASFIHPHPPFAIPKPWHKLYRVPQMPLPNVPPDSENLQTWINRYQNRYKFRDRGIDLNLVRLIKAYYYAAVSFVDYQIGRIIRTLEETGQLENTLIMFTSDHGEYLGDYNCFGKRNMHDASSRVPMIVRYPKRFGQKEICTSPVSLVDVYPTLTSVAEINTENIDLDGVDLYRTASGASDRKEVFTQYEEGPRGIYMVATENWKYYYSAGDNKEFLFDRIADPLETRNKAELQAHREIKDQLKQTLLRFLKSHGITDAYSEKDGRIDWKTYPYYAGVSSDPDAGLVFQDAPGSVVEIEGYST